MEKGEEQVVMETVEDFEVPVGDPSNVLTLYNNRYSKTTQELTT